MIQCVYQAKWNADACTLRCECLHSCRAGWLAVPSPCEGCGTLIKGPLLATIADDGDEYVIFRILCMACAERQAALDEAKANRYRNVRRLVEGPTIDP